MALSELSARSTDWYVDVLASCEGALGTQARPFCRIQQAIQAASDGDTVHIAPGVYRERLSVNRDVHLKGTEGEQYTVVEPPMGRVVAIPNGTTSTLEGLTLQGGRSYALSGYRGAGVYILGGPDAASVTFLGSTIHGNLVEAPEIGPAIGAGTSNNGGDLLLVDSTVTSNHCFAEISGGGGISSRYGTLTLINSTISDNTVTGRAPCSLAYGGGITSGGQDAVTIQGCRITGNLATIGRVAVDRAALAVRVVDRGLRVDMGALEFGNVRLDVAGEPTPKRLMGRRACPPEDCGGAPGCGRRVVAVHDSAGVAPGLLEWIPDDFDPSRFDRARVNELLRSPFPAARNLFRFPNRRGPR